MPTDRKPRKRKPKPVLLPCPWCGKEPELRVIGDWYSVSCTGHFRKCKVASCTLGFRTRAAAVRAWNTRKGKP